MSYHQFSQSVRAKKKVLYTYILLGSLDIFELSERSFAQISPYIYEDKDLEQHDSLLTQASLSAFLQDSNESFATMLLRLIHEKGLNEIDCYKKANVDRKLFSKIKNTCIFHKTHDHSKLKRHKIDVLTKIIYYNNVM